MLLSPMDSLRYYQPPKTVVTSVPAAVTMVLPGDPQRVFLLIAAVSSTSPINVGWGPDVDVNPAFVVNVNTAPVQVPVAWFGPLLALPIYAYSSSGPQKLAITYVTLNDWPATD